MNQPAKPVWSAYNYKMDHISVISHQPGFASAPCTWMAINGTPIEQWCAEAFGFPDAALLGLAQMWLVDEAEADLALTRITPGEEGTSTIVPILVCSDDMDLACTVVVVEQLVTGGTVQWLRWGLSASTGLQTGISTNWESSPKSPLAVFDRKEFDGCLQGFGRPS